MKLRFRFNLNGSREPRRNFYTRSGGPFNRRGIPNLMMYIVAMQILGFFILRINPAFYFRYLSLDASAICRGEIWRLVTYLCYPASSGAFFMALAAYVYYRLGILLENVLGSYRFTMYIFLGILGNILAALVIYMIWGEVYLLTANDLYLSMLLLLAALFPELEFRLYFIIPIKAKWLGLIYGAMLIYSAVVNDWPGRIALIMSFLNLIVFFLFVMKAHKSVKYTARKVQFKAQQAAATAAHRHRCAVCGITDISHPDMEFRYCSKCEGSYEYCKDHLYTHVHVTKST